MLSRISTNQSMRGSNTMLEEKRPTKIAKAFEKATLQIKNDILDDLLQVYSWRSKTDLPIAKVMFYKVISKNTKQIFSTVQVSYQTTQFTIYDMAEINLQNTLYLLQQSTIGFQKLFQVFGSFLISNKMIIVNKNNKCKVWINQNLSVNQPIAVQMFKNLPEKSFIQQILSIFQKKCKKTGVSNQFIGQVMNSQTFQQILTCINSFAAFKKIAIPSTLKFQDTKDTKDSRYMPSKSPIKNISHLNSNTSNSFINKDKSIPKFLNKSTIRTAQTSNVQSNKLNQAIQRQIQKSKSIGKFVNSNKNMQPNKSQIFLKNHFQLKKSIQNQQKSQKLSNDYSFEEKKRIKEGQTKIGNTKILGSSTNSFSHEDIQQIFQGRVKHKNKDITKSQLKSSFNENQQSSLFKLQKKMSLFDQERNMLQSIVHGPDEYKKSNNSTFQLTKLGKLGRHIGQSRLPQDF